MKTSIRTWLTLGYVILAIGWLACGQGAERIEKLAPLTPTFNPTEIPAAPTATEIPIPTETPTTILPTTTPMPSETPPPEPVVIPPTESSSGYSGPFDPAGPDRDCPDFSSQAEAQAFYEVAGGPARDPHRLDKNHNGIACEDTKY